MNRIFVASIIVNSETSFMGQPPKEQIEYRLAEELDRDTSSLKYFDAHLIRNLGINQVEIGDDFIRNQVRFIARSECELIVKPHLKGKRRKPSVLRIKKRA